MFETMLRYSPKAEWKLTLVVNMLNELKLAVNLSSPTPESNYDKIVSTASNELKGLDLC
jgi:hypothetical protein